MGDLFLLNTRCELTNTIRRAFEVRRHFLLSPCVVQLELFIIPMLCSRSFLLFPCVVEPELFRESRSRSGAYLAKLGDGEPNLWVGACSGSN